MRKENKPSLESACKAGSSEKTARKYLESGKLPSGLKEEHTWCTREDPFESNWPEIKGSWKLNQASKQVLRFSESAS